MNNKDIFDICLAKKLSGGSGGSFGPSENGLQFNNEYINLPFQLRSTDVVKVDFTIDSYIEDMVVLGNSNGFYQQFFLVLYIGDFYTTNSNSLQSIDLGSFTSGRHTFEWNINGNIKFDDEFVVDGQGDPIVISPADWNYTYTIGYRNAQQFTGQIHRFTIIDGSTSNLICDLLPYGLNKQAQCLYDVVNDKIYAPMTR